MRTDDMIERQSSQQFIRNAQPIKQSPRCIPLHYRKEAFELLKDMKSQEGLIGKICEVYIDDIIVRSKTFSEHLEHLEIIFDRLLQAGLKINTKKCVFFQHKVPFLGQVIFGDKIECDPKKVETITNWPIPKNKTDLRGFLGLCSYYRRFIKNFSLIAKDLHKLTEEKIQFIWDDIAHQAFENLKKALSTAPVLTPPDPNLPFILDTDASYFRLGAVLSQVHRIKTPDGKEQEVEKVVAYYNKILNKVERTIV
ncbi:uncharacterized protein LOC130665892 [Microplitis mediator]|uniref:uncharacterized protein LOC130665892 n=1 Tax=Microplitis mediator TaxID=375433 RepID=UPI0025556C6B|nr:uncharacterized protein LOC130665892 [Microplitis mediator]